MTYKIGCAALLFLSCCSSSHVYLVVTRRGLNPVPSTLNDGLWIRATFLAASAAFRRGPAAVHPELRATEMRSWTFMRGCCCSNVPYGKGPILGQRTIDILRS